MSSFQDTDLFLINRSGVNYKISYADLTNGTGIASADELMVQRGGTLYSIEYNKLGQAGTPIQENDYFLVERDSELFAAQASGSLSSVPNLSITCDSSVSDSQYLVVTWSGAQSYNNQPPQIRNNASKETIYLGNSGTVVLPKSFVTNGGGLTVRLYGVFTSFKFDGSKGLKSMTISNFNESGWDAILPNPASNFGEMMFRDCSALTSCDNRIPVKSMKQFFQGCSVFNSSSAGALNVSGVKRFDNCFGGCTAFNNVLIRNWDMSSATNLNYMFSSATSFTDGGIRDWGPALGNVTNFSNCFVNASQFNGDISNWDVSGASFSANGLDKMFSGASLFSQDLTGWCVTNFPALPTGFSANSSLTGAQLPLWGTCP
jgi:hypothetical protein